MIVNITPGSVFDTFPWPQFEMPEASQRSAGGKPRSPAATPGPPKSAASRRDASTVSSIAALDAAVGAAYGFSAKKDLLAQHLALNQSVVAKIETGEAVTAPGVPKGYPDPRRLVTDDCIRPGA